MGLFIFFIIIGTWWTVGNIVMLVGMISISARWEVIALFIFNILLGGFMLSLYIHDLKQEIIWRR